MATIKARKDGTMELKELLGDDLYKQVQAKIDEKNSTELEKLNGLITGKDTEIGNANKLIEELKKASKGDEGMQQKISTYETENARLQKELEETKVNSAIKVALLEAHAVDTDYMTYKIKTALKEKNEELKLDDEGHIKGWDNMLTDLKTQFPAQFTASSGSDDGERHIIENRLPDPTNKDTGLTREDILKKSYAERAKIAQETPELYEAAMHGTK